jgi:hypothetical protein
MTSREPLDALVARIAGSHDTSLEGFNPTSGLGIIVCACGWAASFRATDECAGVAWDRAERTHVAQRVAEAILADTFDQIARWQGIGVGQATQMDGETITLAVGLDNHEANFKVAASLVGRRVGLIDLGPVGAP